MEGLRKSWIGTITRTCWLIVAAMAISVATAIICK